MMSQIPCKQSIRIEMSGWFKHYFPGNLRRNFLFKVCNYTSYQNLQKNSLPNPFAREATLLLPPISADVHFVLWAACADTAPALCPAFSRANGLGREFFCRFW